MYRTLVGKTLSGVLISVFSIPCAELCAQASGVERDVEFVRALAKDLGFISLAQEETNRLQRVYQDSADFQHVAQLGIEISLVGAKMYANRERQRTLYRDAVDRCKELLSAHSEGSVAQAARLTLGEACFEYGRFLVDELELARQESPELVSALETEAADIFRVGVDSCEAAMKELRPQIDANQAARLQYGVTWLQKGILLREHGRAVRRDRAALCAFAKNTLEELVFSYGEDTALGLKGLFEYGQCDEVLGNLRDAEAIYQDTIAQLVNTLDQAQQLDLTAQNMEFLFSMMQEIYDRLATLQFDAGNVDRVLETATEFRGRLVAMGKPGADIFDTAHERFGHSLLLTEARAQASTAEPELVSTALAMINRINDRHPEDIVGLKAKALLKDVLSSQNRLVSGTLLFEVAKGDFQKESYESAINGLKRALAAMTDEERNEMARESYYLIGRAFSFQERHLEAVLAFKTGLERHGAGGDPMSQQMSERLDRSMRSLRRVTRSDPNFNSLNDQVVAVVASMGGVASANQMNWSRGDGFMGERDYAQAATAFGQITNDYLRYDVAQSRKAIAQRASKDYAGARRTIAAFRTYAQSTTIADNRADLQAIRDQALAEMAYTEANMLYNEATGSAEAGTEKDLTKYPAVVAKFQSFINEYSRTGANFLPRAHDILGRLHAEGGDLAMASEAYNNLRRVDSGKTLLPMLGTVIFSAYRTEIENLEKEGTGEETLAKLQQERSAALAIGLEYARTAAQPSYGMLFNSMRLAEAVGDWQTVDEMARLAIDRYGDNPTYTQRVDAFVRPAVGQAALQQRKFQQAYDMLSAAEKASPNNYPVKRLLALSLGGWVEYDQFGNPEQVMGLGDPSQAYEIFWGQYRTYGLNRQRVKQYSLEWYQFHWEAYWFAKNAADKDSAFNTRANGIYRIAASIDDFANLRDNLGPEGRQLWQMFTQFRRP